MAVLPFIQAMEGRDPDFFELMKGLQEISLGEGVLDSKTKLLVALAVDACNGSVEGVKNVSTRLKELGATDREIAEVLRIVYFASGNCLLKTFLAVDDRDNVK